MFRLIKFGIKAGLATSAVYLTVDNGVWKDSKTTEELYDKITAQTSQLISPYLEQVPIVLPELPKTGSFATNLQVTWNKGVNAAFRFLVVSPTCAAGTATQWYKYVAEKVNESIETSSSRPN